MAARSESARRISICVTALLRDQPFFRQPGIAPPIRADETRETLASDGKDIRYAPQWVADTDADRIKTALARVVLACALKHHTRRGGRDPERWQRASQLVTHGLLRDAGFSLPPDAEAWDGISAEQAYDRLPEPPDDAEDPGGATPSGTEIATEARTTRNPATAVTIRTLRQIQPMTAIRKSKMNRDRAATARARNHPGRRRPATTLAAPARSWTRTNAATTAPASPANRRWTRPPRNRRGTRPCIRPPVSRGRKATRGRRRGDDPASAPEHPRLAVAVAPLPDRRRAPRL